MRALLCAVRRTSRAQRHVKAGMEEEERLDDFSAVAWELAARGKSGRDIATLHETWAASVVRSLRPDAFERAQVQQLLRTNIIELYTDYGAVNMN